MYQAYVGDGGFLTEVFRNRNSAEEWIKNQIKNLSMALSLTVRPAAYLQHRGNGR